MKDDTRKLLGKADQALHAATILLDAGDPETAIGRAYAMFHTAQALLREKTGPGAPGAHLVGPIGSDTYNGCLRKGTNP